MLIIGWIFLSAIVGIAAKRRFNRSEAWGLLAVIISPLIAGLLLLALGPKPKSSNTPQTKFCSRRLAQSPTASP